MDVTVEYLPTKWVEIKGQRFDIGRTINPTKCSGCQDRDCMNCSNYAKQMKRESYTVTEWVSAFKDKLELWNQESLNQFFDSLIIGFPKGLYWDYASYIDKIRFVEITRSGFERVVGSININNLSIIDMGLSKVRRKFINKVAAKMCEVEKEFKGE